MCWLARWLLSRKIGPNKAVARKACHNPAPRHLLSRIFSLDKQLLKIKCNNPVNGLIIIPLTQFPLHFSLAILHLSQILRLIFLLWWAAGSRCITTQSWPLSSVARSSCLSLVHSLWFISVVTFSWNKTPLALWMGGAGAGGKAFNLCYATGRKDK